MTFGSDIGMCQYLAMWH